MQTGIGNGKVNWRQLSTRMERRVEMMAVVGRSVVSLNTWR